MEPRPRRVRGATRVGLAILAALVIPAISWAQDVAGVASTTLVATPADVMAAASAAIPVLKADSSMAAALVAQYASAIRTLKDQIAALEAKIKQLQDKIDQLHDEIEKLRAEMARTLEALARAEKNKEAALAEIKDAKSSLYAMRMVASDRAAASKLLDAMKQRNASTLGTLLDPGSSPASIVSVDVLSPSAIKMIFKVGVLTQCVATRPNCGTATYSIVK